LYAPDDELSEDVIVVVTDGDLVFKLMSLPWEARAELLRLLGGLEACDTKNSMFRFEDRTEDSLVHTPRSRV
jgi:hypothetical protein